MDEIRNTIMPNIDTAFSFSPATGELYFGAVHGGMSTFKMPHFKFIRSAEHPGHGKLQAKTYGIITKDDNTLILNYKIRLVLLKLLENIGVYLLKHLNINDPYVSKTVFHFEEQIGEHLQAMAPLIPEELVKKLIFRSDFNLGTISGDDPQPELMIDRFIETLQLLWPQADKKKITMIFVSGSRELLDHAQPALRNNRVAMIFEVKGGEILGSYSRKPSIKDAHEDIDEAQQHFTEPEMIALPGDKKIEDTAAGTLFQLENQHTLIFDGLQTYNDEEMQILEEDRENRTTVFQKPDEPPLVSEENDNEQALSSTSTNKKCCCSCLASLFNSSKNNRVSDYKEGQIDEASITTGKDTTRTAKSEKTSSITGFGGIGAKKVTPKREVEISLDDLVPRQKTDTEPAAQLQKF